MKENPFFCSCGVVAAGEGCRVVPGDAALDYPGCCPDVACDPEPVSLALPDDDAVEVWSGSDAVEYDVELEPTTGGDDDDYNVVPDTKPATTTTTTPKPRKKKVVRRPKKVLPGRRYKKWEAYGVRKAAGPRFVRRMPKYYTSPAAGRTEVPQPYRFRNPWFNYFHMP